MDIHSIAVTGTLAVLLSGALDAGKQGGTRQQVLPPSCAELRAALLSANGFSLSEADETRTDTERIQKAIDTCPPGHSVHLSQSAGRNAFLAGALTLKSNVSLVLDDGVTLFASRDPRDFQIRQGSCGIVDDRGSGCRPLLAAVGLTGAGLAGNGVVDGRGNAKILGETFTWQELEQEAKLTGGKVNAPSLLLLLDSRDFKLGNVQFRNAPSLKMQTARDR